MQKAGCEANFLQISYWASTQISHTVLITGGSYFPTGTPWQLHACEGGGNCFPGR